MFCILNEKKGFTIIELIIVVSIIMILLGFAIPMAGKAKAKARRAQAKAEIAALETALSAYYADVGSYPTDTPTAKFESSNAVIVKHLSGKVGGTAVSYDTTILAIDNWNGPYMEFDAEDIVANQFVDPWGDPYSIDVALDSTVDDGNPPVKNGFSFDIMSTAGSSGDTSDDIANY